MSIYLTVLEAHEVISEMQSPRKGIPQALVAPLAKRTQSVEERAELKLAAKKAAIAAAKEKSMKGTKIRT